MNFVKTSFLSGLSTAISLLARLISTKIVAVYLGTNGMCLMGQLKDFLRLGNTIGSFGIEMESSNMFLSMKIKKLNLVILLEQVLKLTSQVH